VLIIATENYVRFNRVCFIRVLCRLNEIRNFKTRENDEAKICCRHFAPLVSQSLLTQSLESILVAVVVVAVVTVVAAN